MNAPRLWLVRHARPLVDAGVCYGRLDLAADAKATRSAAQALARALPPSIAATIHSPLQRCELLAFELQAFRPDLASNPEPAIAELDFGAWEGCAWSGIARADIDRWSADFPHHAPGGGESLAHMLQRVARALHAAQERAAAAQADVVWLSHAGVARCVQWLLAHGAQRLPQAHEWPVQAPGFGAWTTLPLAGAGTAHAGLAQHYLKA